MTYVVWTAEEDQDEIGGDVSFAPTLVAWGGVSRYARPRA